MVSDSKSFSVQHMNHINLRSSTTIILLLLNKKTITPSYQDPKNDLALGHFHMISFLLLSLNK